MANSVPSSVTCARDLKPGMAVWMAGRRWLVASNEYRPTGGAGMQPECLLRCDAIDPDSMPAGAVRVLQLGLRPYAVVSLG